MDKTKETNNEDLMCGSCWYLDKKNSRCLWYGCPLPFNIDLKTFRCENCKENGGMKNEGKN